MGSSAEPTDASNLDEYIRGSTDPDTDLSVTIDEAFADWRPGRSVEEREARRESSQATVEWLRQVGKASTGKFKSEAYPEHGLDGQSAASWWEKTDRPALQQVEDAGLVEFE